MPLTPPDLIDPHDLAAATLIAHRAKGIGYVATLLGHRLIDGRTVHELIKAIEPSHEVCRASRTRPLRHEPND